MNRDEIHWWVFCKEHDLELLRQRSQDALSSAETFKNVADNLLASRPESQVSILQELRQFVETHQHDIQKILGYLVWLRRRNPLAPSMMFTYRIWGTTRRGDRRVPVIADDVQDESDSIRILLVEHALGLRIRGGCRWTLEMCEALEENDGEFDETETARRAWWRIYHDFSSFLTLIRDSLRNIVSEIERCKTWRDLRHSDVFWRRFIDAAIPTTREETQLWDFKRTLNFWHIRGPEKSKAKTKFAQYVAGFANAEGGVLVVGITDSREIVGVGVSDLESALKSAKDVVSNQVVYPRDIVTFHKVMIPDSSGSEKACLIIMVAKTSEPVSVKDSDFNFSWPIRRETGLAKTDQDTIRRAKEHFKSDNYKFIMRLEQFVRDTV